MILKNQINMLDFIVSLIIKLIQDPFEQIAIMMLTDPRNKVALASIGAPLIPQEYLSFVFRFIDDSSMLTSNVSFVICFANFTANKLLIEYILSKFMFQGLNFTLLYLKLT